MAITYTRLRDQSWGLRSTIALQAGQSVTVARRDGTSKTETVGGPVWAGQGVFLYTITAQTSSPRRTAPRRQAHWEPCGYPGCNQTYCDQCDGRGYPYG